MDAENHPPELIARDQSKNGNQSHSQKNASAKPVEAPVQRRVLAVVQNNVQLERNASICDAQSAIQNGSSHLPTQPSNLNELDNAVDPELLSIQASAPNVNQEDESMEVDIAAFEREILEDHNNIESSLPNPLSDLEKAFREPEYREGFVSWRITEEAMKAKPTYMHKQVYIDWEMRSVLVDWLVEVSEEFKLCCETLHLSVLFVDRFLSLYRCQRENLQLVGVAAMFIASKYEEIYPPTASEFIELTDSTYTVRQLLKMETKMIKALDYKLTQPTTHGFLMDFIQRESPESESTSPDDMLKLEQLSKYISELALLQGEIFLEYLPSKKAVCALHLAARMLNFDYWIASLPQKSGYSQEQMKPCIQDMDFMLCKVMDGNFEYPAIKDKYSESRLGSVALIRPR